MSRHPGSAPAEIGVLLVEDNPGDVELVRSYLANVDSVRVGLRVAGTVDAALEVLAEEEVDAVLLDLDLPDSTGVQTVRSILAAAPSLPVVVLTGAELRELGVEAMREGASDLLRKEDVTGPLLVRSIRYAIEREARHHSERLFRALIESSRDLVAITEADFTLRYLSPSLRAILGYEPEETLGAGMPFEVHDADRERVVREARDLLREPAATTRIQCRVRHREGGWRWLDVVAQNSLDDPSIRGLVVHARDITGLRAAEEEVRASRRRFEILQSAAATANEVERLDIALQRLITDLPEWLGWDVGHAWILDGDRLRSLPIWHAETPVAFDEFREASAEMTFGPGEGMVGKAMGTGEVAWMVGLAEKGDFLRAEVAGELRRGLAIPILAAGEVVAVLELFSIEDEPVDDDLLALAGDIGHQLGRVAERERAISEIRRSRNLLRQLVEGVPDAMFIKDREGRYVLINEAGASFVGKDAGSVVGRTDEEIHDEELAARIVREDRRILDEAVFVTKEDERTDAEGRTRTYLYTKGPLLDAEGRVSGIFGISRNVTELKRARAALQERVKELRTLYRVRRELARTGATLDERLRAVTELLPPGWLDPEVTEARIQYGDTTFETAGFEETPWRLSSAIAARDQTIGRVDVVLTRRPAGPEGEAFLPEEADLLDAVALAVAEAVERDRLEEEFLQAQKLEAVGRLSGGVAHDFNNLLTVIRAHADFLLLDLAEDDELVDEVRVIRDATDQAAQLTSQLLAFSREQVLQPRVIDLNDTVRTVRRLVTRVLGEDVRVETRLADDIPPTRVDPGHLEQALLNLAVNARDAMPAGGTLTLETSVVEIDREEAERSGVLDPGRHVRLTVRDTGVGMDEEVRKRVFEPFYSTKGREKGTGLGLSMVYGFVTQSGGAVHVESEPGRGTSFFLHFPAVEGEAEHVEDDLSGEISEIDTTARLLVVEDDASVRRVARMVLERAGFDVETYPDAESGLEAFEADGGFEVVLTDIVLPGMSGRELIDRLLERESAPALVAMSGYAEESPGHSGGLPAEVSFVQKPFATEELVRVVIEAVRSARR